MARRITVHKQYEFETGFGTGYDAAKNFCDRLLQNPAVKEESILVDVYSPRLSQLDLSSGDHVRIEWDVVEMQRESNKERRQSKWRRRTRCINTQMS